MRFVTLGCNKNDAILFFHAMGVVGESSEIVAQYLSDTYYCIMPTSTAYCEKQKYVSKNDELAQIEAFLKDNGVKRLQLVVVSSLSADLAAYFLKNSKIHAEAAYFDDGQFAKMGNSRGGFLRRFFTEPSKASTRKTAKI